MPVLVLVLLVLVGATFAFPWSVNVTVTGEHANDKNKTVEWLAALNGDVDALFVDGTFDLERVERRLAADVVNVTVTIVLDGSVSRLVAFLALAWPFAAPRSTPRSCARCFSRLCVKICSCNVCVRAAQSPALEYVVTRAVIGGENVDDHNPLAGADLSLDLPASQFQAAIDAGGQCR